VFGQPRRDTLTCQITNAGGGILVQGSN